MCKEDVLDSFYNVLFHPVQEFRRISEDTPTDSRWLVVSLMFVLLVSAFGPIVLFADGKDHDLMGLIYKIPMSAVSGLLLWVLMAGIIALLAYVFMGSSRFKTFLTLSGYATLPWVFLGPVVLLKTGLGGFGTFIGVVAGLSIWLWSVVLFALALGHTYRLTADRVIVLLAMPFVMGLLCLSWFIGFAVNIQHLFP